MFSLLASTCFRHYFHIQILILIISYLRYQRFAVVSVFALNCRLHIDSLSVNLPLHDRHRLFFRFPFVRYAPSSKPIFPTSFFIFSMEIDFCAEMSTTGSYAPRLRGILSGHKGQLQGERSVNIAACLNLNMHTVNGTDRRIPTRYGCRYGYGSYFPYHGL